MEFSYQSIRERLINRYSEKSGVQAVVIRSSVIAAIIDLFAWIGEKVAYYFEIFKRENNWKDAQFRESLVSMAYLLTYYPHRKIGATGDLLITPLPYAEGVQVYSGPDIQIPKWFVFTNEEGDASVYTTEAAVYQGPSTVVMLQPFAEPIVNLGQGQVRIRVNNHTIATGQEFTLTGTRNYDGNYINLNNSIDPQTKENYLIFEADFYPETPNTGVRVYSGYVRLRVKQGTPKEFIYRASGVVEEIIPLYTPNADQDEVKVYLIDSDNNITEEVEQVRELFSIRDFSKYYCEVQNADDFNSVNFIFGDGLNTRKLLAEQRILFQYAETDGVDGNIPGVGTIITARTPLLDANENPVTLSSLNITPIVGGENVESLESIRSKARAQHGAGESASTREGWKAAVQQPPIIALSSVTTDFERFGAQVGLKSNIVYISAVTKEKTNPTNAEQQMITLEYLNKRKALTDFPVWERISVINPKFYVKAKVQGASFTVIQDLILNALLDRYDIFSINFAESLYNSNYTAIIDQLNEVIFHDTYVSALEKSKNYPTIGPATAKIVALSRINTEQPDVTKQVYILENSVKIWLQRKINGDLQPRKQIALSFNNLSIQGTNGYEVNGAVNPLTNEVTFNIIDIINDVPPVGEPDNAIPGASFGVINPTFDDLNGYYIELEYRTKDGVGGQTLNLRLPKENDIVAFEGDIEYDLTY